MCRAAFLERVGLRDQRREDTYMEVFVRVDYTVLSAQEVERRCERSRSHFKCEVSVCKLPVLSGAVRDCQLERLELVDRGTRIKGVRFRGTTMCKVRMQEGG